MKTLYDSIFQTISYSEEHSLLMTVWKPATSEMTDDNHLSEIHTVYMHFRRHNPVRFLSDINELQFEISPDGQKFSSNLFKENAASYIAIVTNANNEAQESVKEAFQEFQQVVTAGFTMRYYKNRVDALEWLISSQ